MHELVAVARVDGGRNGSGLASLDLAAQETQRAVVQRDRRLEQLAQLRLALCGRQRRTHRGGHGVDFGIEVGQDARPGGAHGHAVRRGHERLAGAHYGTHRSAMRAEGQAESDGFAVLGGREPELRQRRLELGVAKRPGQVQHREVVRGADGLAQRHRVRASVAVRVAVHGRRNAPQRPATIPGLPRAHQAVGRVAVLQRSKHDRQLVERPHALDAVQQQRRAGVVVLQDAGGDVDLQGDRVSSSLRRDLAAAAAVGRSRRGRWLGLRAMAHQRQAQHRRAAALHGLQGRRDALRECPLADGVDGQDERCAGCHVGRIGLGGDLTLHLGGEGLRRARHEVDRPLCRGQRRERVDRHDAVHAHVLELGQRGLQPAGRKQGARHPLRARHHVAEAHAAGMRLRHLRRILRIALARMDLLAGHGEIGRVHQAEGALRSCGENQLARVIEILGRLAPDHAAARFDAAQRAAALEHRLVGRVQAHERVGVAVLRDRSVKPAARADLAQLAYDGAAPVPLRLQAAGELLRQRAAAGAAQRVDERLERAQGVEAAQVVQAAVVEPAVLGVEQRLAVQRRQGTLQRDESVLARRVRIVELRRAHDADERAVDVVDRRLREVVDALAPSRFVELLVALHDQQAGAGDRSCCTEAKSYGPAAHALGLSLVTQ